MPDEENWPRLISRYRKIHVLTQSAFAARFDVAQQTVSRWENGQQSPHLQAQQALRTVIGAGSQLTTECWRNRVEHTRGLEMLFAPGWTILAMSKPLLVALGVRQEDHIGTSLSHLHGATHQDIVAANDLVFGRDTLALKIAAECLFPDDTIGCNVELWPVKVSDNDTLCHAVGYVERVPKSAHTLRDFRVLNVETVMAVETTKNNVGTHADMRATGTGA